MSTRRTDERPVHVGAAWRVILSDLGIDPNTVLRRAGLPLGAFRGEGTYISLDSFYALHEAVEAENSDPQLALKAGSIVSVELFDPALFAAICSPDMKTAVQRLGEFKRLVGAFTLDLDEREDSISVTYRCKRRPDMPRLLGLSEMVFLVAFARRATREKISPMYVEVRKRPSELEPFEAFFGAPLVDSDRYAVVLDHEDAALPFLTHNAKMWEEFEPSMRRRMLEADEASSTAELVQLGQEF